LNNEADYAGKSGWCCYYACRWTLLNVFEYSLLVPIFILCFCFIYFLFFCFFFYLFTAVQLALIYNAFNYFNLQ
jgi:hypothetical protein